ncbi:uncharacterized protein MELLADRAFT_107420 [Melampsora larici-populina 98AG31]|uniref:Uncharacterized protein n=1 Tax=Melampsora larici-populina (strain 98AG31 / pathotype 3-4-7) TaxID=747676 RepID=F4RPQ8_MELLP|nr:uncharacterized protein MELLADRAFT_107420 [Melampsora larici-populina 98AG31]EGG05584.1 hypothetical protein MELLADRAFT_107420 [Melampsora larici-populina 98AG31]
MVSALGVGTYKRLPMQWAGVLNVVGLQGYSGCEQRAYDTMIDLGRAPGKALPVLLIEEGAVGLDGSTPLGSAGLAASGLVWYFAMSRLLHREWDSRYLDFRVFKVDYIYDIKELGQEPGWSVSIGDVVTFTGEVMHMVGCGGKWIVKMVDVKNLLRLL